MIDPKLFTVYKPHKVGSVPILISIPHAGTAFPQDQISYYNPEIIQFPSDTDWLVDKLYDFAPALGITVIVANYSRYVVDLNRHPENQSLYNDRRLKTEVIPTLTFDRRAIYSDNFHPQSSQLERIVKYHMPYYHEIESILCKFQESHRNCIFFDAHSIKRNVPSIQTEPFPDLIFGTRDQSSCANALSELAYNHFKDRFNTKLNDPFKGGNLTKTFGDPGKMRHAIQLEMSQDLYLDMDDFTFNQSGLVIKSQLEALFVKLIHWLKDQNY